MYGNGAEIQILSLFSTPPLSMIDVWKTSVQESVNHIEQLKAAEF